MEKEILRQHHLWVTSEGGSGKRAECEHINMIQGNYNEHRFDGAILPKAQMCESSFKSASFRGADLRGADFSNADLSYADFVGADLQGANFAGADLWYAHFNAANLEGAKFNYAHTAGASFRDANLTDADFRDCEFPLDAVKRAKINDKVLFPLFKNIAGLDMSACNSEIRDAVKSINQQIRDIEKTKDEEAEGRCMSYCG